MPTEQALEPVSRRGSLNLLWTLAIRAVGLTAGVAIALLLVAALIAR
jgi:hypothetical protein